MFDDACSLYWDVQCSVGGGNPDSDGKIFGMGCLVTPTVVITASHVYRLIEKDFSWPVVRQFDGFYRCEIVFDSPDHDVMALRPVERIRVAEGKAPARFPHVFRTVMRHGLLVGYLANNVLPAGGTRTRASLPVAFSGS